MSGKGRGLASGSALVLVLSLLASACGGSKTVSTQEWADNLCSSINTWKSSISSTVSSVGQSSITKDSLTNAVDQGKSATQKLSDDLKGLGKPNTEAGQEAQSEVDQLSDELNGQIDKIENAVDDASGAQGTLNAVSVASSSLSTMIQQVKTTFTELQGLEPQGKNEIKQAFQNAPSCQKLKSGSSSSSG
jgi:hypothetical protein